MMTDDSSPVDWEALYLRSCGERLVQAQELDNLRARLNAEYARADGLNKRLEVALQEQRRSEALLAMNRHLYEVTQTPADVGTFSNVPPPTFYPQTEKLAQANELHERLDAVLVALGDCSEMRNCRFLLTHPAIVRLVKPL
jgi:hypothetical protein